MRVGSAAAMALAPAGPMLFQLRLHRRAKARTDASERERVRQRWSEGDGTPCENTEVHVHASERGPELKQVKN